MVKDDGRNARHGGLNRRTLLGGALALTLTPPIRAAARPVAANAMVARLGTFLRNLEQQDDFAGTILLAQNGQAIFHQAYGMANREFRVRNRGDTRFNLASIGKMFTAVAIMRLIESGRVALSDRLVRHLPTYPNQAVAEGVTIEQLLTHRSGIGNFEEGHDRASSIPLDRLVDYLPLFANDAPMFAPGAQFGYSNAAYVVLGLVIEAATGEEYFDHSHLRGLRKHGRAVGAIDRDRVRRRRRGNERSNTKSKSGGHPRRSVVHQPHNLVDITRAGDPNVRRLLAVHSLPWRGMNRRLIVQFDPDEPSMSAPTFAEPDQVR